MTIQIHIAETAGEIVMSHREHSDFFAYQQAEAKLEEYTAYMIRANEHANVGDASHLGPPATLDAVGSLLETLSYTELRRIAIDALHQLVTSKDVEYRDGRFRWAKVCGGRVVGDYMIRGAE